MNGMFAIAVYDRRNRKNVFARDHPEYLVGNDRALMESTYEEN